MKLIVDSGSTKAAWYVALPGSMSFMIRTAGINPVRDDLDAMRAVVGGARVSVESELVLGRASSLGQMLRFSHVYFYGAGCIPPYSGSLCSLLQEVFPEAEVAVESDLLGAARALCGHAEGIACILGTGSNSCAYDGERIVHNVSPLGFILGDEGSGAVLGKLLLGDVLKHQLPQPVIDRFNERYGLSNAEIIERVYRQKLPNRFLASFVPFLADEMGEPAIHSLVVKAFRSFLQRNVKQYDGWDRLPVGFVGSVAFYFRDVLREALEAEGMTLGRILQAPMDGLIEFHADHP